MTVVELIKILLNYPHSAEVHFKDGKIVILQKDDKGEACSVYEG